MSQFGDPPKFEHLTDETLRASLIRLREHVAPILANNLLPHFTDHSVAHSDSLADIVDRLTESLQLTVSRLDSRELMIIYAACYLHDVGMQYEKAYETGAVQRAMAEMKLSPVWDELAENTRRELLRRCHHEIAAEMIVASVGTASPLVGIQLTDEYDASRTACVCEAHGVDVETPRYTELTADGSSVRMSLLTALLRIADLLDESRRRASREKERTLDLDTESRAHWWRHYYTEDIVIDQSESTIRLLFDFPRERRSEYGRVVPLLQKPYIEAELAAQSGVLGRFKLNWLVTHQVLKKAHGTAEQMTEDVLTHMVKELGYRQATESARRQAAVLEHFVEARPIIARRLSDLGAQQDTMAASDYLRKALGIATDMWELGGRRSAWTSLEGIYDRCRDKIGVDERFDICVRLCTMILDDQEPDTAFRKLADLQGDVDSLSDNDSRFRYWRLTAQCAMSSCYLETPSVIGTAIGLAPTDEAREELEAWNAEWCLLQADFGSAFDTVPDKRNTP